VDLQSLQCPVLNDESYTRPLAQLVARAWEVVGRNAAESLRRQSELEAQAARGRVIELEDAIRRLEVAQPDEVEATVARLQTITYHVGPGPLTLEEILRSLHVDVAGGMSQSSLTWKIDEVIEDHFECNAEADDLSTHVIGDMNLLGMISLTLHREPTRGGGMRGERTFVLTDLGRRVMNTLLRLAARE
jgi:hypothetical protein